MLSVLERNTLQGNQVAAPQAREGPWIRSLRASVCCLRGVLENGRSLWAWVILHIIEQGQSGLLSEKWFKTQLFSLFTQETGIHSGGLCISEIGERHYLRLRGKKFEGCYLFCQKNIRKRFSLLACMEPLLLAPCPVCMLNTLVSWAVWTFSWAGHQVPQSRHRGGAVILTPLSAFRIFQSIV